METAWYMSVVCDEDYEMDRWYFVIIFYIDLHNAIYKFVP